ncbi:MAG TPA: fimbria/pilus periplasmic chaperone [Lysobacter sp.]|jgi:fimbrial chaperone protein|nr:fimbria/pilus periplasmic chaperone [Lysobacter sp.]
MSSGRRHHARRVLLAAAWLVLSCAAGVAGAAQFSLNQTRVHLNGGHAVETLVLANDEGQPVNFEIEVKRWRQDADGHWELTPTDALVVHPLILSVPAGGQARVRVGTLSPSVGAEEAYRIELQQLPDAVQSETVHIKMLTRLSVPVFVQPSSAKPQPTLAVTAVDATAVQLIVHNDGTGYLAPQDAKLRVLDAEGRAVHEDRLAIGYVLAGAQLKVAVKMPAGVCARANRIELTLDKPLPPLEASIAASVRQCGR